MKSPESHTAGLVFDRAKMLAKAKHGDPRALRRLVGDHRAQLYDYLMRMTGEVRRSIDTIDEVFLTLSPASIREIQSADEIFPLLITTSRKFSMDIWNGDISRLENAGLEVLKGRAEAEESHDLGPKAAFDRAYRSLPGPEREVLWLATVAGLADGVIARIMFKTESEVAQLKRDAMGPLVRSSPLLAGLSLSQVAMLWVLHPMRPVTSGLTMELSRVMQAIKDRPPIGPVLVRIAVILATVLILAAVYLMRDRLETGLSKSGLGDWWRSRWQSGGARDAGATERPPGS